MHQKELVQELRSFAHPCAAMTAAAGIDQTRSLTTRCLALPLPAPGVQSDARPHHHLWADLADMADEFEEDEQCESTLTPVEWLSSCQTADSFEEEYMGIDSIGSGSGSGSRRGSGFIDLNSTSSSNSGIVNLNSKSNSSALTYLTRASSCSDIVQSTSGHCAIGQGAVPSHHPAAEALLAPKRRFRLKNKKLEVLEKQVSKEQPIPGPNGQGAGEVSMVGTCAIEWPAMAGQRGSQMGRFEGEWSRGSAAHGARKCRRCLFYDSPIGCIKGADCDFCHLPHYRSVFTRPSKAKRDRYAKLFQDVVEKRAKLAAAAASASASAGSVAFSSLK